MSNFEALLLGIFQGITEFLPVSSTGHLVIAETLLGLPTEQLLPFDALLHAGSLGSLLLLFWREILAWLKFDNWQLLIKVLIAAVPVGVVGILYEEQITALRSLWWVGIFFILTAFFFIIAEYLNKKAKKTSSLREAQRQSNLSLDSGLLRYARNDGGVFLVAIFQVFALFAGVSRSGVCTAAAMMAGTTRNQATEFAFLVGLPVIGGVSLLQGFKIYQNPEILPPLLPSLIAFFASLISGYLVASWLLKFFRKHSLYGFAVYLFLVGISCIILYNV